MSPIVKSFLSVSAAYLLHESRGRSAERPDLAPRNADVRSDHPKKTSTLGSRSDSARWGRQGLRLG